jgi:type I restriction enzyme S subunit
MDIRQDEHSRYTVTTGDLLVCEGGEVGRAAIWDGRLGVCGYQKALHRLRPRTADPDQSRFLLFALFDTAKRGVFQADGSENTIAHLTAEKFRRYRFGFPPPPEQSAIVRFLDHADRRIRRHIRAKQKLIQLLEEQKQAIIHRAVTRGLDPHVRLKPSGAEWLGDVPEHWEVTKLYRVTDPLRPVMYGIVLPGPNVDQGVFIVKGGNCESGRLHPDLLSRTTFDIEAKYVRSRLKADDIVYAIRGSIGAAELVPAALAGANLTQDAARIAPGHRTLPRWLLYFVRSRAFFLKLDAGAVGATIRGINIRDLKRVDLVLPPLDEQRAITRYLDAESEKFSLVNDRAHREISLLREYRTRLIADVVTGKLDVRAAASLPDEADEPEALADADALAEGDEVVNDLDAAPEEAEA